jgi:capsular polysaccharide biosynthesis protein
MDEANLPELPSSPNRLQIALIGLLAGLVLGVGASLGRELLDSTLSTEEEAAAELKMPVLVSVYEISNREARRHARKKNIA